MSPRGFPRDQDPSGSNSNDAEVARVLEAYLVDLEAGRAVDPARLLADHPAIAPHLRACLEVIQLAGRADLMNPPATENADDAPIGPRLAGHRIIRRIGRGRAGIVYLAEQDSPRRLVALKTLSTAADPPSTRRFQLELQTAARLHHSHVAPVHAAGFDQGVPYFTTRYINGKTLAEIICDLRRLEGRDPGKDAPTPDVDGDLELARMLAAGRFNRQATPDDDGPRSAAAPQPPRVFARGPAYFRAAAGLGLQAAEALDHAHREGIIHGDLRPSNVMVDVGGRLWLMGFGTTEPAAQSVPASRASPNHAPARRESDDRLRDVQALGAILYELTALEPARRGIPRPAAAEPPKPLRAFNPPTPGELEAIIRKAMADERGSRYATAQDMADDLRTFLGRGPRRTRRPALLDAAAAWFRGRRGRAIKPP